MKIAFICQAVDTLDPVQAGTLTWLKTMAAKPRVEEIFVIALRTGKSTLPEHVKINAIQGQGRLGRLRCFYALVSQALRRHVDCFFVYQSGPYPALLLPVKLFTGKGIFQWRAHPHIDLLTRFYVHFCVDTVFTSTAAALPMESAKIRIVGQGIDTSAFRTTDTRKDRELVTVGRLTPSKRLDTMIRTVALLNKDYGESATLDIYGSETERDRGHRQWLEGLVADLQMSTHVKFHGAVEHIKLPDILNRYRVFLNFADTALDRAVVEAMACGLPVASSNQCVAEILTTGLQSQLMIPHDDAHPQAERIHQLLSLNPEERTSLGETLRDLVLSNHSIESLVDTILGEMTGA